MKNTAKLLRAFLRISLTLGIVFGVSGIILFVLGITLAYNPESNPNWIYIGAFWPLSFLSLLVAISLIILFVLGRKAFKELLDNNKLLYEGYIADKYEQTDDNLTANKKPEELHFSDIVIALENIKIENDIVIPKGSRGKVLSSSSPDFPKIEFISPKTNEKITSRIPRAKVQKVNN